MELGGLQHPGARSTSCRVGLLGPLVVEVDGVERPITARRQRAVLARLAVRPAVPISADQLLDDVWGDVHPATGRRSVAYQISMLRSSLQPDRAGAGALISTSVAGYALEVGHDDVDVHRFRRLVGVARDALPNDPSRSLELVDEAMTLWRGTPFGDLGDAPFVDPEVRQLEQQLLLARITGVEARLALGRAAEVIAELQRRAAEHPLVVSVAGLLMTALHRVGRTADALRAFDELRRRLAVELGIEPARQLRHLEDELVAGRPDPAPMIGGPRRPRPRRMPAATSSFVGRSAEIHEIGSALSSARLVTLCGFGGLGKTRLAHEVARRLDDRFDDGVWYVDLVPVADERTLAATILGAGGLTVPASRNTAEHLVEELASRTALVVLDNCEHLAEPVAELTAAILPAAPGVRVLATSRLGLGVADEVAWAVPPLDAASALELFEERARLARPGLDIDDTNRVRIERIVDRLDGIPLAIEMAAARLATMGVEQVESHLDDVTSARRGLHGPIDPRQESLDAVMEWSYRLLDEPDRLLLRRMSVCVGGFDLDAAIRIGHHGPSQASATDVLDRLGHLIETAMVIFADEGGVPRFRMLEVVRRFASQRGDRAEMEDAAQRHAVHYQAVAAAIDAECAVDYPAAVRWGEREIGNLRAAMRWAYGSGGDPRLGLSIAVGAKSYFHTHNRSRESLGWLRTGLENTDGDDALWMRAAATAVVEAFNCRDLAARRLAAEEVTRGLATTDDPALRAELLNALAAHETETDPRAALARTVEALELDASPVHRTVALLSNLAFGSWEVGHIDDGDVVLRRLDDLPPAAVESHPPLVTACLAALDGRWDDVVRISEATMGRDVQPVAFVGVLGAEALGALGRLVEASELLGSVVPHLEVYDRRIAQLIYASIELRGGLPGAAARRLSALADEIVGEGRRLAIGAQVSALLGVAACDLGQASVAAVLLGHAAAERARIGIDVRPSDRPLVDRAVAVCRAELSPSRYEELTAHGAASGFDELPTVRSGDAPTAR